MVSREKTELMIITGIARKSMDGTVKIVWYDWNIVQTSLRRKICHCGQGNQGDQGNCANQKQIDQIKPDGSDGQLGDNQHPGLDRERVHQIALVGIEIFIKTDSKIDCQDHGKTAENQDACDVKYKVSH